MSGGDGRGPSNTGLGHNGGKPSGNVNGSSGHGGPSSGGGYHYNPGKGPASTVGPDGEVHINITGGMEKDPLGKHHGNGGSGNGHSAGNHNSNSGGNGKTTSIPGWSPDSGKPGRYLPTNKDKLIKGLIQSIDDHSGTYTIHYTGGAVATVTVPNGDVNKMNVHYNIGSGPSSGNKLTRDTIKSFLEFKAENEANAVNDAISKVNDFYKELASKYGDKLEKEAKALADEAKGKKIRNANEAIKAFDRYKDVLNKKFSVSDREAIAKALESLNKDQMAKQLKIFGKAFGVVGEAIQWGGFISGLVKGFRTGDWSEAFISGEKIAVGKAASVMVTVVFSAMAVNTIGILGFAVIMAVTSALITDERLKQLNSFINGI
ncbi:TPA: hypothetical protein JLL04_005090 [Escherichia coli]|uniref:Channel forming colicins domain-containing protein n=1 Tax=Escherichia coli TaxID=562 RepID=A0A8S7IKL0_ECOLX|nr:colicin-like pore-forming protein [Escherichia coli]HDZ2876751.1 hypothetical protein [Klebsiella pneumoniae]EEV5627110.1 hypothetical protein [Escherichia coli]EFC2249791.1 hypothetical protein [Escherichia coli]EFC4774170.1 hypothetical protein [Escherichia coli]EFE4976985.1 hypothetical protein [Escherichia coli]